jgi:hypothetical protein
MRLVIFGVAGAVIGGWLALAQAEAETASGCTADQYTLSLTGETRDGVAVEGSDWADFTTLTSNNYSDDHARLQSPGETIRLVTP